MPRITADPTLPRYGESREMPWNVMGGALASNADTVAQALAETGLDYTVRMTPLEGVEREVDDDGLTVGETRLDADEWRAVVRPMPDGTDRIIGVTGRRFRPIQNVDAFAPADYLVSEFGAKVTGAADFRNGKASLLVVDLARPISLTRTDGGEDPLNLYLLIKNAHDGSAALTMALTAMRLACTNAVQAAIANAERSWKVSHTPKADARLQVARQSMLAAIDYHDAFQEKAQAMIDTAMVDAEFDKIISRLWAVKPDAEGVAAERRRAIQDEVRAIYHDSPTLDGVRGTRWGAYSAVTEWLDHFRPVKGDEAASRAEGALEGPYVRMKANVWKMLATV